MSLVMSLCSNSVYKCPFATKVLMESQPLNFNARSSVHHNLIAHVSFTWTFWQTIQTKPRGDITPCQIQIIMWLDYFVHGQSLPVSVWLACSSLHLSGQGSSTWEESIVLRMVLLSHWLEALRLNKLARERLIFFLCRNILERKGSLLRDRLTYS